LMDARRPTLATLVSFGALAGWLSLWNVPALAGETCSNEAFRPGLGANLPDCRAYELVTPADKGIVQDMFGEGSAVAIAIPSPGGSSVALQAHAALEPGAGVGLENNYIFSRALSGWEMTSLIPPGAGATEYRPEIFSPDLSQVGLESDTNKTFVIRGTERNFVVGPPGGPYTKIATTPAEELQFGGNQHQDTLLGASPDFSHVVFGSADHTLLSATPTGTDAKAFDLYEWVKGQLRLVNVTNTGSVIGKCGAMLGGFRGIGGSQRVNSTLHHAVSADGSKVFFTSPDTSLQEGEGCFGGELGGTEGTGPNAPRLYMRVSEVVGGHEESRTAEVSAPAPGVTLSPAEEELPVTYEEASMDGSKIFFKTARALTVGAAKNLRGLYEYDTEAPESSRLTLVYQGALTNGVYSSNDGSVAYFFTESGSNEETLYRYEAAGGGSVRAIATLGKPSRGLERSYVTPNGEFFLFSSGSGGVAGEPRGEGRKDELYQYDNADRSVMCVSCGPGKAPTQGNAHVAKEATWNGTPDTTPGVVEMSDDGRYVFFESSASLTPKAVNDETISTFFGEGFSNVYEWEADGTGACAQSLGCTYLISQGNSQIGSFLIGASSDGRDVFIGTHAQLLPQDIDAYGDIYDARIGGGFPPPPSGSGACQGDACQSPPAAPNDPTPASSSFSGPGNPMAMLATSRSRVRAKMKRCGKGRVLREGRCVKRRAMKASRGVLGRNRGGFVKHDRGGSK
jgi:hypothetical protein